LVNDNSIPEILKKKPKLACVVGLNTEPERLVEIRKNRMNSLKENTNKLYTDLDQVRKEVEAAKKTFKKYKWPSIDVTRKSVEETAASIIKIYEIYKENA
jgi:regulator of PEP synthase PpsR (kinase-PPPase family)